jgi:glycosyltransferase involved in cell wall biosynthesis
MPVKKKILIVLYYYHPYVSGLSILAKSLAEGLASRGHYVTVLTTRHDSSLKPAEEINGVHIIRTKVLIKASKGVVSLGLLKKIIELSKIHDIVSPQLPMAHFGFVLPFIDTRKVVPQYHCDLSLGVGLIGKVIQKIAYWSMDRTLQKSSRIIVTTRDYFSNSHFNCYASRACEIYPPINQARFGPGDASGLRACLAIEEKTRVIGFVGRVVAEKGLEYLLCSIPLMEEKLDDFVVLIAGEHTRIAGGSVKRDLDPLLENFPGRIKIIGHLQFNDLVAFYNLIDVLVLPSVDPLEAFGIVQIEAMLCGTPVVASNMPGVREVINKTGFGRLVKKRDPQDLADKIIELLENPITVDPKQLTDFNYDRIIDQYEEAFFSQGRLARKGS